MARLGVSEQTALLRANVEPIAESLLAERRLPPSSGRPVLVVLVGLPASGKSHFARLLAERVGAVVVASDTLRRRLFVAPSYVRSESRAVFELALALARRLLARGHVVIVDATNLCEPDRGPFYALGRERSAPVLVVRVVASDAATSERLRIRASRTAAGDASEADASIHLMMVQRYQEPARPYLTVDTSDDLLPGLERVEEAIRLASV